MAILYRAPALFGPLALALVVAGTIAIATTGVSEQTFERESSATFAPSLADHQAASVAARWLFNFASLALVGFAAFLRQQWRGMGGIVDTGAALTGAAGLLFVIEASMTTGVIDVAAPFIATQGLQAGHPFVVTVDSIMAIRNHIAHLASGILGFGILVLGLAVARDEKDHRWRGRSAILVGLVGLVGTFTSLLEPLSYVRLIGLALAGAWIAYTGLILHGEAEAPIFRHALKLRQARRS